MTNSKTLQKTNNLLALAYTAGALVMLFSAGKIMAYPNVTDLEILQAVEPSTKAQCELALKSLGYDAKVDATGIQIHEQSTRSLPELIERGSLAAQACPGFNLTEFCAGEDCLPERGLVVAMTSGAQEAK